MVMVNLHGNPRSSDGSLVVTPDCDTAVLGSNPAISQAYSGLPVLRWAVIWDGTFAVGCPLSGSRGEYIETIGTSNPPKTIKEKKVKLHAFGTVQIKSV
jgi:hypothetical protein